MNTTQVELSAKYILKCGINGFKWGLAARLLGTVVPPLRIPIAATSIVLATREYFKETEKYQKEMYHAI